MSETDAAATSDPFALTEVLTITATGPSLTDIEGSVSEVEGSATTPVPEPASLAMLGTGLFALGLVRRRRMQPALPMPS